MPVKTLMSGEYAYDWGAVLPYDADITAVVGARGIGKTFGMREQFLRDFHKKGKRFCAITRNQSNIAPLSKGYMDKVLKATENYNLRKWIDSENIACQTRGQELWIGHLTIDKKGKQHLEDAQLMGYFVALSNNSYLKEQTFTGVNRVALDEFLLPHSDRYHKYLNDEYSLLANVVDTVTRERPGDAKPHIYLMANACDLYNPYFAEWGVEQTPRAGLTWHCGHKVLIDNLRADAYGRAKQLGTVAGRMLAGTDAGELAAMNDFAEDSTSYIEPLPYKCRYAFSLIYRKQFLHAYINYDLGKMWLSWRVAKGQPHRVFALSKRDGSPEYHLGKSASTAVKQLMDVWGRGLLFFEKPAIRERFYMILDDFGQK